MTNDNMKKTILICLIFIIPAQLQAQKYITAAGVRFSNEGFGLSLQQRIFEHTTIEAIGQINFKEVSATAGLNRVEIDNWKRFAPGMYVVQVLSSSAKMTGKITVQ